ncbi:MAG: hypothetical protein WCS31_15265, partial [Verrucomicrobiae bacterium]
MSEKIKNVSNWIMSRVIWKNLTAGQACLAGKLEMKTAAHVNLAINRSNGKNSRRTCRQIGIHLFKNARICDRICTLVPFQHASRSRRAS